MQEWYYSISIKTPYLVFNTLVSIWYYLTLGFIDWCQENEQDDSISEYSVGNSRAIAKLTQQVFRNTCHQYHRTFFPYANFEDAARKPALNMKFIWNIKRATAVTTPRTDISDPQDREDIGHPPLQVEAEWRPGIGRLRVATSPTSHRSCTTTIAPRASKSCIDTREAMALIGILPE